MLENRNTASRFDFDIDDAVRRYADMVYRLAVLNTPCEADAEDIFQEVFLKLFRFRERIESEEHLKAWLIRVTINQCRSLTASAWNKRKVSMESIGEMAAEEAEDRSDVLDAVRSLPEKYALVIHLYYYEGLQINEIAKLLGKNEATIKTQLARGRNMLKSKLGAYANG
jgi:RNA polymerase sigma-70 factor (ECF subfamily)